MHCRMHSIRTRFDPKMDPLSNLAWSRHAPDMERVRVLLRIWSGTTTPSAVSHLIKAVWRKTRTPEDPRCWDHLSEWIQACLTGEDAELAARIWAESKQSITPGHLYGVHLLIDAQQFLLPDSTGVYQLTPRGQAFLDADPVVMREVEDIEYLPDLVCFMHKHSNRARHDLAFRKLSQNVLHRRLLEILASDCLLAPEGKTYRYSQQTNIETAPFGQTESLDPRQGILKSIRQYNNTQIQSLRNRLGQMSPYRFEELICNLLKAMEYTEVTVTKRSGDKGVDVIASHRFGITQIREVVQVKRYQGSIHRPVIDQLRGALPYHQATSGTIITLGSFAISCIEAARHPGAFPITLIDGDNLIDLLIEHRVGIQSHDYSMLEIDDRYFAEDEDDYGEAFSTLTD